MDSQTQQSILSQIRHELRTPINAIIGYSEMLLEELEVESQSLITSKLQNLRDYGVKLLLLVNSILNPERLAAESLELNLIETIRVQLEQPLNEVMSSCEQLREIAPEFILDLDKIYTAAKSLQRITEEAIKPQRQLFSTLELEKLNLLSEKINDEPKERIANPIYLGEVNSSVKVLSHSTILVVDDNETNQDLLSQHLTRAGYGVAVAADGLQAVQMIQTGKYDLVLLDILMPVINGYQVLKWLNSSQWRNIPVIMISALDEVNSVVKCIEMGAEDYLPKPFNSVLLRARIGACLEKKRLRDQEAQYLDQLAKANQEIISLNEQLKAENLRLSAELEVTRRLQQMILPKEKELDKIDELEIAGYMQPADEVGGDYYDVLQYGDKLKIGIGDVTGHGLESGVLMIMVQTAVRTLMENHETDPKKFLDVLNRTIYKNVQRMNSDKNLTLSLIDYQSGKISLSGQHEEMIVVRFGGRVEKIDTISLGFPLGLEENISDFIAHAEVQLYSGDTVVLYTDGVTEAENELGEYYGLERLCNIVKQNWQHSANQIRQTVIEDLQGYIGKNKVYDDMTLLIFKQK